MAKSQARPVQGREDIWWQVCLLRQAGLWRWHEAGWQLFPHTLPQHFQGTVRQEGWSAWGVGALTKTIYEGENVVIELCDLCGVPVLRREMEDDYHKGWHTVSRKVLKPFVERRVQAPECDEDVLICQDCAGKSLEPVIVQARIRKAEEDLDWLEKRIEQDTENLKRTTKEYRGDITEGKRLVPLMKDHIKQLKEKSTSTFDYQEHERWDKQRREHHH